MRAARTPLSMGMSPAAGAARPVLMRNSTAATPASSPASANAARITRLLRTPSNWAVSKSSAAARMAIP